MAHLPEIVETSSLEMPQPGALTPAVMTELIAPQFRADQRSVSDRLAEMATLARTELAAQQSLCQQLGMTALELIASRVRLGWILQDVRRAIGRRQGFCTWCSENLSVSTPVIYGAIRLATYFTPDLEDYGRRRSLGLEADAGSHPGPPLKTQVQAAGVRSLYAANTLLRIIRPETRRGRSRTARLKANATELGDDGLSHLSQNGDSAGFDAAVATPEGELPQQLDCGASAPVVGASWAIGDRPHGANGANGSGEEHAERHVPSLGRPPKHADVYPDGPPHGIAFERLREAISRLLLAVNTTDWLILTHLERKSACFEFRKITLVFEKIAEDVHAYEGGMGRVTQGTTPRVNLVYGETNEVAAGG